MTIRDRPTRLVGGVELLVLLTTGACAGGAESTSASAVPGSGRASAEPADGRRGRHSLGSGHVAVGRAVTGTTAGPRPTNRSEQNRIRPVTHRPGQHAFDVNNRTPGVGRSSGGR